jgi:hypothetical protein
MDSPHALLPRDAELLDTVEGSTFVRVAEVLDTALWQSPQRRAATTPAGYRFVTDPEDFRGFVAGKDAWAVRAFACLYAGTCANSPQRILEAEVEWVQEDLRIGDVTRELALDHLIELVEGLDAMLTFQASADVEWFSGARTQPLDARAREAIEAGLVRMYRRRHIAAGFHRREFSLLLHALLSEAQRARLEGELAPLVRPLWRFQ